MREILERSTQLDAFKEETAHDPPDVFESRENFKAMVISKSIPIIIASSEKEY